MVLPLSTDVLFARWSANLITILSFGVEGAKTVEVRRLTEENANLRQQMKQLAEELESLEVQNGGEATSVKISVDASSFLRLFPPMGSAALCFWLELLRIIAQVKQVCSGSFAA